MSRILSPFLDGFFNEKALLDERCYNSHMGFEIVLKTGATIPVASGDFILTSLSRKGESVALDEPIAFESKLISMPDIKFSQTASQDGGTAAVISNLDYFITQLIPEESRLFDGAMVTVYLCFKKPDGTYEGLIYGVGNLTVAEGDDEDANVSYVSDMSDTTKTVAGREITQRCLNELGVITGKSFCPANNLPDGAVCSKVFEDAAGGCRHWGQEPFFKGVPWFNPNGYVPNAPINVNGGGNVGNPGGGGGGTIGGWDEPLVVGGGGCPDVNSWFRGNSGPVHGSNLRAGTVLLDHLDRPVMVTKVERVFARYRYFIESPTGAKGIFSADHPILTSFDDDKGTALYALLPSIAQTMAPSAYQRVFERQVQTGILNVADIYDNVKVVEWSAGARRMSPISYKVATAGVVLKLSVNKPNIYIAGTVKGAGFAGHNLKPLYDGLEVGYSYNMV